MSGPSRSRGLAEDAFFPALKRRIIESTGLAYFEDKDPALADKVSGRLSALDMAGCASYLALLRDGTRGEAELDELVAELTVGETYFFRFPEQFEALRRTVLPAIIERNAARRSLRIWSAGCSTGAEPYSIAMLLRRDFGGALAGWDWSILGTDINRRFLASAARGIYGEWALRGLDAGFVRECFESVPEGARVRDEFRDGVSFQYHNLVKHPYPSLVHNLAAFDLILCRNVMIYFAGPVIAECAGRFLRSLVPGGWLVVGHAEMNRDAFRGFAAVERPGTVLFRSGEPEARDAPGPWSPAPLPEMPRPLSPRTVPREAPAAPERNPLAAAIKELADRAAWDEAVARCEDLIAGEPLNPLGHFYQGLILDQLGSSAEAEAALNRAIYLDRGFVLAHYHKGLLLQKTGDSSRAARAYRVVLDLLDRIEPGRIFEDADGIAARDLAELAKMQLELQEPA